jgi:surface protein
MQPLVYEFGGTGTTINVGTMPSGLLSNVNSGTLTISGTPVFTNNDYSFSVFTTDGNANCSQVSQTVTLSKNQSSPSLTLDSGTYNQTITLGDAMQPIVVTYGGATSGLVIRGLQYFQSGNIFTINRPFPRAGTYSGTITTVSSGGCNEIIQNIAVTVNAPVVTNTGVTTSGGTTTSNIAFDASGTCKCAGATVGYTQVISGTTYTVVDNSIIADQIAAGNVNLCTTLVTDMSEFFKDKNSFNSDIGFWDTSNVTNMEKMFYNATVFNQNINSWDVSSVTNMMGLFLVAEYFNQDISSWDVSNVTNMNNMFKYTRRFNQNISSWNVSGVTNMSGMFFEDEDFNVDIGNWNVSNVTDMTYMFGNADSFNKDLTGWCVTNISSEPNDFTTARSALTNTNKPSWGNCPP